MSAESNLRDLQALTGGLSSHESQEIRDVAAIIWDIAAVIVFDHQPSFRRRFGEPRLGYSCFAGAGEETLKNLIEDLKITLKPARIFLKPKLPSSKVVNSIRFSPEEICQLRRLAGALGNLVMQERLTAYIPYMLNKFRTVSEWRHSRFAKMGWPDISTALANDDDSLDMILSKVSYALVYDIDIVKKWIQRGSNLTAKDTYLAQCVNNHEIIDLYQRVWRDEHHLRILAINDDIEAQAYLIAFKTFREEWFTLLWPGYYELTEKAHLWLSAQ